MLDVIKNENLMSSAKSVGRVMFESLNELKTKYPEWIGDIRGHGLVVGIEIVSEADGETRAPNSPLAVNVMYSLKADEKTLVGISGKHRNVLFISPPMCFNMENCRRLVNSIENVLAKSCSHLSNRLRATIYIRRKNYSIRIRMSKKVFLMST